jgi:hypothetical protein
MAPHTELNPTEARQGVKTRMVRRVLTRSLIAVIVAFAFILFLWVVYA